MQENYYVRNTCRLCDSKRLTKVLSLTPTALCDDYRKTITDQPVYPLDLFQCDDCGFAQIEYVVSPDTIYSDYIYVTTSSSDLHPHFASYAKKVSENLKLQTGCTVFDVGSNDGTLLNCFQQRGYRVLGIEPCKKIAEHATNRGIETLPEFFDLDLAKNIKKKYGLADLITLNNVFANIDDVHAFAEALEYLLADNGVLIIEASYLLDTVKNMVFDYIYHEHLSHFSILPLVRFFLKFQLRLIRVESVPTKGGSLRYYFARQSSKYVVDQSVAIFTDKEKRANINTVFFSHWANKIEAVRTRLLSELDKNKDKKIFAYGASATSTTLIYHFGLSKYISCLIDDNPRKIGTYSPGTHIPVQKLENVSLDKDSVVLILAWRFYEPICTKLSPFQCTIIIPLPSVQVITSTQTEFVL